MEVIISQKHALNITQLREATIISSNFRAIERWANTLPLPPFQFASQPASGEIFQFDGDKWTNVSLLNAVGLYVPYTPSFTGFTLGNGTVNAYYKQTATDMVHTRGWVKLGSTSSFSSNMMISPPSGFTYLPAEFMVGTFFAFDDSAIARHSGVASFSTTALNHGTGGKIYVQTGSNQGTNSATPFTWATDDVFAWSIHLQLDS